jgi:hypothetical protein
MPPPFSPLIIAEKNDLVWRRGNPFQKDKKRDRVNGLIDPGNKMIKPLD